MSKISFFAKVVRWMAAAMRQLTARRSQQSEQPLGTSVAPIAAVPDDDGSGGAPSALVKAWEWLSAHYRFRLNMATGQVEVCERRWVERDGHHVPDDCYHAVNAVIRNSLLMKLQRRGIPISSPNMLDVVLRNDSVPCYDPVRAFLGSLPEWDGSDHIGRLMEHLSRDPFEQRMLHVAFVAMAAQMQGALGDYGNTLCPILISSRQGIGKSQFVKRLLPPELADEYIDSYDPGAETQSLRKMARYSLINLDEIDRFSPRRMASLKNQMQMSDVRIQKMYTEQMETHARRASFWGTSNNRYVLTDESGSRRFLPVVVTDDLTVLIAPDYGQLYAQAVAELASGAVRPYLTQDENALLERHNHPFCLATALRDRLLEHYEFVPVGTDGCTASEVFNVLLAADPELMKHYTENNFGEALKDCGAVQWRHGDIRVYNLRRLG